MTDVIDVTDATFVQDVVEESKTRPVVVDFWAAWCAPCRALSPVLERLAGERAGAFRLAKIDVDANPMAAGEFRVMSIPAVKAFVDGAMVDEFTGALPEDAVRAWLDGFVPAPLDDVTAAAVEAEERGDLERAESGYRSALDADPDSRAARLGLARVRTRRGETSGIRDLLKPLEPDPDADRILATLTVAEWADTAGDEPLAVAKRAAARGDAREALEGMLMAVGDGPEARQAMLAVFAVLGDDHPLVREFRPKLASALF